MKKKFVQPLKGAKKNSCTAQWRKKKNCPTPVPEELIVIEPTILFFVIGNTVYNMFLYISAIKFP